MAKRKKHSKDSHNSSRFDPKVRKVAADRKLEKPSGEQVTKAGTDNAGTHFCRGMRYYASGHWEKAVEALKQAIKIMPAYPSAQFNLGASYLNLGYWKEAVQVFRTTYQDKTK